MSNESSQKTPNNKWLRKPIALSLAGLAASAIIQTPQVYAQASALEEVIVTANRREESLQSVAMAVSAFSEDMMRDQGIVDLKGITERTPGFTMGTFNPGQPQLYIRGIGSNEDGAGGDQSVIVFIDEVYIGRSAGMDIDLFDLERVEVLRGPQGTLFGKNVVGGAVNMVTRKPTEETVMQVEATLGDYNARTLRGLVSGELSEGVYGKASFSTRRRDGYFESALNSLPQWTGGKVEDTHDINSDSFRMGLRFTPSEDLEINLSASHSEIDKLGQPDHFIEPPSAPGLSHTVSAALIPNYDNKIHTGLFDVAGYFKSTAKSVMGRIDWNINDDVMLTSITSFRNVDAENSDELGPGGVSGSGPLMNLYASVAPLGSQILFGANFYTDESDTITQELRFTSTDNGPLQWVGGLYYMEEETKRVESIGVGIALQGIDLNLATGQPNQVVPGTPFTLLPYIPGSDDQFNTTTSMAIFGQVTYDITDKLSITAGARYTTEEKELDRTGKSDGLALLGAAIIGTFDFETSEDWSELTKKVSLQYQQTDDIFWYATYSEGFKSGGYQGMAATEIAASSPFDPEYATLYEAGVKSEWMDNKVRLNASIFTTDYEDLQILQLLLPDSLANAGVNTGVLVTQNAADAVIDGLELEFTAFPMENLTVQGSATWLDTEFDNFSIPAGYSAPAGNASPDRSGNGLRNAPDFAYNLLVRYDWQLASGASLAAQVDWRYKDLVWQDPDNLEFAAVPEYSAGDLRLIYTTPSGNTQVSAWVTNFTDEDYFLHNYPTGGVGNATPAPPRMVGLTVFWRNN
jgi:iron complex outermembrane receptor protein